MRAALLFAILTAAGPAQAIPLTCAQDERTDALFCFAAAELRESGGIRTAPLYMGGPNAVRRTAFTIAANCSSGVMHLKDRDGVSFAGVAGDEGTQQSRELLRDVCAANVKPKPK